VSTEKLVTWSKFADNRNGDIVVGLGDKRCVCNEVVLYSNAGSLRKRIFYDKNARITDYQDCSYNGRYIAFDSGVYLGNKLIRKFNSHIHSMQFRKNILYFLSGGGLGKDNKFYVLDVDRNEVNEINLKIGFIEKI
jgi:hypothetical protein